MRLSDVVSGMNATVAPEIGLAIFLVLFLVLVARLWSRASRKIEADVAALALDDGQRVRDEAAPGNAEARR